MLFVGSSGSGKTEAISTYVENFEKIHGKKIENIYIYYESWQVIYDKIAKKGKQSFLHNSFIDNTEFKENYKPSKEISLVIIDDYQYLLNKSGDTIRRLVDVWSRHMRFQLLITVHSLQGNNNILRYLLQNSRYIILLKSFLDTIYVQRLLFPHRQGIVTAASQQAFDKHKCRYLMIDNNLETTSKYRLKANCLEEITAEKPGLLFVPIAE